MLQTLELLAPAKNLECGIAAVSHGADAVYIGAPRFGARAAAGNTVADISRLCDYAHQYSTKVYVTVNTIIYDNELESARQLLRQLQHAGVDAVLVQDMALLSMSEALEYHASTQTDNRTPEKVSWLRSIGFKRVVLARELSIEEIRAIHEAVPDIELEAFVHGALCVSYSGMCYASQYCFHRSANRGECAQFCRMQFDLIDADGKLIEHHRHLLSLKDMNRIDHLEELAEAGVTSFKIEGRLKDVAYVKNVTAAYSLRLNQLVSRHPDKYRRASLGTCRYTFTPDLQKTFHRGYTTYFLHGRQPDIASFDTPKAMGELVGTVKEVRRDSFIVSGTAAFSNGDGLCFLDKERRLQGFRVNRVGDCPAQGDACQTQHRLFPQSMPEGLLPGMKLYRNSNQAFDRLLSKPTAERKIPISMTLSVTPEGFRLSSGTVHVDMPSIHQLAEKPQHDNIVRQLTKLGNTPYSCDQVSLPSGFNYFIPSSQLSDLRRQLVNAQTSKLQNTNSQTPILQNTTSQTPKLQNTTSHLSNISNSEASHFYGIDHTTAYELHPTADAVLMQCRHCLRYSLGFCVRHGGRRPTWREPLFLRLGDGRRFRLEFDCLHCQMNVYASPR